MVTKRDDDRPTDDDRGNIGQSASGRWTGRVLQLDLGVVGHVVAVDGELDGVAH